MYLLPPIIYLESKDFTSNGNLKHFKNKTCVVMIQANYCGHCTDAKPHFQKFANNNKNIMCLTIEGDGEDPDVKKMVNLITKIKPSFQGFPDYLLYKNGKLINKEINGRTEEALNEYIK
ncbi:Thioredoxin-like [Invertebrate iridescent virus 30]|uniref:Thioredoxin-like n=1 Tax=Invertebrate iridescent virus 30 TaxID=345585 RepID=W8W2X9_9VIRU|nr:Thioredoxin-like [Invertebrate iridescent virus 30]CCV02319.1 Thioredoxin-like [Invertebrate iridescent virus 30]